MTTPLLDLAPAAGQSLVLSPEALGVRAYDAVIYALQAETLPPVLTGCTVPAAFTPSANLLVVQGTLGGFFGCSSVAVTLYLFEVPALDGYTERHAILLWGSVPAVLTLDSFLAGFCGATAPGTSPAELNILQTLSFTSDSFLLFSTLDYNSPRYLNPPFPPAQDPSAPAAAAQLPAAQINGYVFSASAILQNSLTFPLPASAPADTEPFTLELSDALTLIGLGSLSTTGISVTGQLSARAGYSWLNLMTPFAAAASSLPLQPSITAIGVGLPLGSGAPQVPTLEVDGTLTVGSSVITIQAGFDPDGRTLSLAAENFPSFSDIAAEFTDTPLKTLLSPFMPGGDLDVVGDLTLRKLTLSIDCESPAVTALSFALITDKPLSLFDGISLEPALLVDFVYPFESFRTTKVEVIGRWQLKDSQLDAMLTVKEGGASGEEIALFVQLAIGSGLNFDDLADALFQRQLSGLPSLVLSDIDLYAAKASDGSETVSFELEVDSGWTIDGVPVEIDDLTLSVAFGRTAAGQSWALANASAQGTLDIGSLHFTLSADYDSTAKSWTFSAGTLPGDTIDLTTLLTDAITDLGLTASADFLTKHFSGIEVNSCYLQYETSATASPNLVFVLSTGSASVTASGSLSNMKFNDIVFSLNRIGGNTSIGFTASLSSGNTAADMVSCLENLCGFTPNIPGWLSGTDIALIGFSASYNSAAESYHFLATLDIGSNTTSPSALLQLDIDIWSQTVGGTTSKMATYGGTLIFNPGGKDELEFIVELVKSQGNTILVASFHADSAQSIDLSSLVSAIDSSVTMPAGFTIDIQNALFAHYGGKILFAVDMGLAVSLSKLGNLPLIGEELAAVGNLDLAFQVLYAQGSFAVSDIQAINQALGNPSFCFAEQAIAKATLNLATQIRVSGGENISLSLPVSLQNDGTVQSTGTGTITTSDSKAATTGSTQAITWFPVGRSFGPARIDRVGLSFQSASTTVTGYLDGGISVAALTFELLGLSATIPLTGASRFLPTFGLQGLGLEYQRPPVTISGALLEQPTANATEFNGFVTIATEKLQIGALGSYAQMNDGHKSLFAYVAVGDPIGGPPIFFITGLVAGFGYNRQLILPSIETVPQFPLVAEAVAPQPTPATGGLGTVRDFVAGELASLQSCVVPTAGESFLAAGVRFTSYSLIEGVLLAAAPSGTDFQVDIVGLANAVLPPNDTASPVMEAQLALLAHIVPAEGLLWAQGQLTPNSYILSSDCHLTGGFAVAIWGDGPHAGEFVVTIGGYAADYEVPAYFPQPPRVGFNWQVSSDLSLKGGGYFALVPHALMAGGCLDAVWESGVLRAWYTLGADFLIAWKPFHYQASVYVDIGCELSVHIFFFGTIHITIDAGADIDLWGPEFGGHAEVCVEVICVHVHFGISFGAAPSQPPALLWPEFQQSFLPADQSHWLGLTIVDGLQRTIVADLPDGTTGPIWIVKRDSLQLATNSVIPVISGQFTLDGTVASLPAATYGQPGVAPMNVGQILQSEHGISINNLSASASGTPTEQLQLQPLYKNMPTGLWGEQYQPSLNPSGGEVVNALCGYTILPSSTAQEDANAIVVERSSLAYETTTQNGFSWADGIDANAGAAASWATIATDIATASSSRSNLIAALAIPGFEEIIAQPIALGMLAEPQLIQTFS
jgi:hypothetical protein